MRAGVPIDQKVTLPSGYYVVYGGQFESEQAASRSRACQRRHHRRDPRLLFFSFRSLRNALPIMVNLPLA